MTTREYWRSLEARAGSEESRRWVEREFPEGASELPEAEDGVTRRKFLGLLGASVSLAGAAGTGCIRKPVEKILPHTDRPEFLVPGRPVSYATCAYIGGHVEGLLVTSSDGRPTKVEGNPDHPMNLGAASLWAQAEALSIYDPDRGRHPLSGGKPATTTAFTDMIRAHMGAWRGGDAGFALLVDDKPSPTRNHLLDEIAAAYPGAKIYRHDPARPDAGREAMELAGVAGHQVSYRFDQADVVLAVDFDFLATEGDVVRNARLFSDRRRLDGGHDMNRLYVVEPNFSVTGSQADNRLRLSGAKCAAFLSRVAEKLGVGGTLGESLEDRAKTFADAVAADLAARRGRSLVAAGPRQPAA
ncbi:TAT-variant-translocated molybdopterin oxidoreductase, partial [bacterium]|nr:TAT-variant-translocated molybdopterin oxidoreductase [bacterium]